MHVGNNGHALCQMTLSFNTRFTQNFHFCTPAELTQLVFVVHCLGRTNNVRLSAVESLGSCTRWHIW
jgi:hypothetical protein